MDKKVLEITIVIGIIIRISINEPWKIFLKDFGSRILKYLQICRFPVDTTSKYLDDVHISAQLPKSLYFRKEITIKILCTAYY